MRSGYRWLGMLLLCLLLGACQTRDWAFVQSIGGIAVGEPYARPEGWYLPVEVDVSGMRTIAVKPTLQNSGLSCLQVEASVQDRQIFLTLVTALAGGGRRTDCPAVRLGRLAPGSYAVSYRGSDGHAVPLRNIVLGSDPFIK